MGYSPGDEITLEKEIGELIKLNTINEVSEEEIIIENVETTEEKDIEENITD